MKITKYLFGMAIIFYAQFIVGEMNGGLPSYYPANINERAIVQELEVSAGKITMNDMVYSVSRQVQVMLLSVESGKLQDIKKGMVIGFAMEESEGKYVISHIYELPDSMAPKPH